MKNVRRIVSVLVLSALLVACIAVGASAVGTENTTTGKDMAFSDYANVNLVLHDSFETDVGATGANIVRGGTSTLHNPDEVTHQIVEGGGAPYVYDTTAGASSSNGYIFVDYSKRGSQNLYIEPFVALVTDATNDSAKTPVDGFVMEFDIGSKPATTPNPNEDPANPDDDYAHNVAFNIQIMNTHSESGGKIQAFWFESNNGQAKVSSKVKVNGESTGRSVIAAAAGGWIHITMIYDPVQNVITVYANQAAEDRAGNVERTCMGQFSAKYSDTITMYPLGVRLGQQTATYGNFCVDNFLFYQATNVCDPQHVERLTPADAFKGHVELISDTTDTSITGLMKYESYQTVKSELLANFWDGSAYIGEAQSDATLQAAVDTFNGFSALDIEIGAMDYNSTELLNKVNELAAFKRGIANLTNRASQIALIDSFMTSNASFISTEHADYIAAKQALETWRENYQEDTNIKTFVYRMIRFGESSLASALQRHYNAATEVYDSAKAVEAMLADDSVFASADDRTAIKTALEAYVGAAETLSAAVKDGNALRFVTIVKLFEETDEADWESDDGTIRSQWYLARSILLDGNCNMENAELVAIKAGVYDPANDYFARKMQQEHVDTLNARLAVFELDSSNYVDKATVCTFVDNYLERNERDIDFTDARITAIKETNASYKALLSGLELDYTSQLINNTLAFVDQMKNVANYKDYKDVKPLLDAIEVNFYNMNLVGNDHAGLDTMTVQAAVSEYEELRMRVLNIEVFSGQFVAQMSEMPKESSKDAFYEALLVCYSCEEFLDVTYEGVSDYKGNYDKLKSSYIEKTELANTESKTAVDAVCSVRTIGGIGELINHVYDLLK